MAALAGAPLLGRSVARAHLERAIERAQDGSGSFLWISGEAGIGKTSLLDAATALATDRGVRVLRGTAWNDPGTPPFWLWVQVLRDAAGRAGREELLARWGPRSAEALSLLPELAAAPGQPQDGTVDPERFALFDAVEGVLAAIGAEQPLLVALDDLHWTDPGSLRLLRFLTRSPGAAPVVVVATWRDAETVPDSLESLATELVAHSERIKLAGLERGEVAELLDRAAGLHVDDDEAERLRERTGGNPLFLLELARLAQDRGGGDLTALVPTSAEAIIGRRLARVSQACHEILAVAAIAGTANTVETVAALAQRDPVDIVAALDEAVAAGLASEAAGRVEIAHPLIRDCLVRSLAPTRAREVHLAAAELVADDPAAAAEAAHHLRAALPLGDVARAREASRRAAEVAHAARAFEEAVRHRAVELELAGKDLAARFEALLGRGTALLALGVLAGARDDFVQAATLARARHDPEGFAQAALGFAAGTTGFEVRLWDRAQLDLLEEALVLLGDADSALRVDVMARLSVASAFAADADRRRDLAEQATAIARRIGDPRALAHALSAHCDAIAGPADSGRREAEAGEVIANARLAGDRGLELLGLRHRIVALLEQGRTVDARADMAAFELAADHLGQPLYSWYVPLFRGYLAHLAGDMTTTRVCADEADRIGALTDSHNARILAAVQRFWCAIEERRTEEILVELRRLVDEFAEAAPDGDSPLPFFPGQEPSLRRAALPSIAAVVADLAPDAEFLSTLGLVTLAAYDAGDPPEAAAVLRDALMPYRGCWAVDGIAAGAMGPVDRYLGALDLLIGDLAAAEDHLAAALADAASAGAPLASAHTKVLQADVLDRRGGAGDAVRARELRVDALGFYRAHGLVARARELEDRLTGSASPADGPSAPERAEGRFRREGDVWQLAFRGAPAIVRHVKGMTDLAILLGRPSEETHALDLAGQGGPRQGGTGPALDDQATAAYRRRLAELDADIDEADRVGDADAAARAVAEREFLIAELGAAYGLGGRARRTNDDAERARSTVTWRIRDAIKRIEAAHPALGAHLRRSVRTGTFCSYDPEHAVDWEL